MMLLAPHQAHASTFGVAELLPVRVSGYLIAKELEFLGQKTASPEHPFTVILGGAKVSDKIMVIDSLDKADVIIIGGQAHLRIGKRKKSGRKFE